MNFKTICISCLHIYMYNYYLPFSFLNLDGRFENGLRNKFLPQKVISHSHSQPNTDISAELQILNVISGQTQNRCSKIKLSKSKNSVLKKVSICLHFNFSVLISAGPSSALPTALWLS